MVPSDDPPRDKGRNTPGPHHRPVFGTVAWTADGNATAKERARLPFARGIARFLVLPAMLLLTAASLLPLLETRAWWVRVFDFPTSQFLVMLACLLAAYLALQRPRTAPAWFTLAPYSPDLDPFEMAFAKPEVLLRAEAARTVWALRAAVGRPSLAPHRPRAPATSCPLRLRTVRGGIGRSHLNGIRTGTRCGRPGLR